MLEKLVDKVTKKASKINRGFDESFAESARDLVYGFNKSFDLSFLWDKNPSFNRKIVNNLLNRPLVKRFLSGFREVLENKHEEELDHFINGYDMVDPKGIWVEDKLSLYNKYGFTNGKPAPFMVDFLLANKSRIDMEVSLSFYKSTSYEEFSLANHEPSLDYLVDKEIVKNIIENCHLLDSGKGSNLSNKTINGIQVGARMKDKDSKDARGGSCIPYEAKDTKSVNYVFKVFSPSYRRLKQRDDYIEKIVKYYDLDEGHKASLNKYFEHFMFVLAEDGRSKVNELVDESHSKNFMHRADRGAYSDEFGVLFFTEDKYVKNLKDVVNAEFGRFNPDKKVDLNLPGVLNYFASLSNASVDRKTKIKNSVMNEVDLARKLVAPIALLHEKHLYHADIQPLNYVFCDDGEPRISDFETLSSIAKIILKGSSFVRAPEIMLTNDFKPNARSDVYELGANIYYILTGNLPQGDCYFKEVSPISKQYYDSHESDKNTNGIIAEIKSPRRNSILRHSLRNVKHDGLKEVVLCALELNPSKRYKDAGELKKALDNIANEKIKVPTSFFSRHIGKKIGSKLDAIYNKYDNLGNVIGQWFLVGVSALLLNYCPKMPEQVSYVESNCKQAAESFAKDNFANGSVSNILFINRDNSFIAAPDSLLAKDVMFLKKSSMKQEKKRDAIYYEGPDLKLGYDSDFRKFVGSDDLCDVIDRYSLDSILERERVVDSVSKVYAVLEKFGKDGASFAKRADELIKSSKKELSENRAKYFGLVEGELYSLEKETNLKELSDDLLKKHYNDLSIIRENYSVLKKNSANIDTLMFSIKQEAFKRVSGKNISNIREIFDFMTEQSVRAMYGGDEDKFRQDLLVMFTDKRVFYDKSFSMYLRSFCDSISSDSSGDALNTYDLSNKIKHLEKFECYTQNKPLFIRNGTMDKINFEIQKLPLQIRMNEKFYSTVYKAFNFVDAVMRDELAYPNYEPIFKLNSEDVSAISNATDAFLDAALRNLQKD